MTQADSARSMALVSLEASKSGEVTITDELIEKTIDFVLSAPGMESVDGAELLAEIQASLAVWMDPATSLDDDRDHVPWYPDRMPEWRFWRRYRKYLIDKMKRPLEVVARLDEITDDILKKLEDPTDSNRSYDRRGLVVGHVQSGKTANYTGLICKAIDAGYKVVIVLAGVHNSLRSQTQSRLDWELLGFDTAKDFSSVSASSNVIGVAAMFGEPVERIIALTNRKEEGDFKTAVATRVSVPPGELPMVLVVKKNVTVLRNLVRYFRTNPVAREDAEAGHKVIDGAPLLLIDDEADHASVNTKEIAVDEDGNVLDDYDTTKINQLIRDLLLTFNQRAYVGYTATPFANIFIHSEARTLTHGDDLFPRSFIISLPVPSDYFGPARVFGLSTEDDSGLPIIRFVEDEQAFVPNGHKKDLELPNNLPGSLEEAIRCFVLSCAIRRARGEPSSHNSMLVHVTRFVLVQNQVFDRVQESVSRIKQRLRYGDGNSSHDIRKELRELWERDYRTTSKAMDIVYSERWSDIEAELSPAADKIEMKRINGTATDVLDYKEHEEQGVNVITVGGDKLARGLTLEGLTVSYYLRASKMYDTLMQMGRWFGFRAGYEDLCRLYTTPELAEWYGHIAQANEELRELFDEMAMRHETPLTFGLRVRSHPVLMVTSRLKMRDGEHLKLSYDNTISETIDFHTGGPVPAANLKLTRKFISDLGTHDRRTAGTSGTYIWDGVDGATITDFLSSFKAHPAARRAIPERWVEYIVKQQARGELVSWSVGLVSLKKGPEKRFPAKIGELDVRCARRGVYLDGDGRVSIKRLLSPEDELLDFSDQDRKDAGFDGAANRPSGPEIRKARPEERGLLIIYPLDPGFPTTKDERFASLLPLKEVPVALGISFPRSDTADKIDYEVNRVDRQWQFADWEYRE